MDYRSILHMFICLLLVIPMLGKTNDATKGMKILPPLSLLSAEHQTHAKTYSINRTWSVEAFTQSGNSFRIDQFPISLTENGSIQFELSPSVIDGSTEIMVGFKRIPAPDVRTYTGTIIGEPGSNVVMSFANGILRGWIERVDGSRVSIAPSEGSTEIHLLYDAEIVADLRKDAGSCMTDESSITIPTPEDLYKTLGKVESVKGTNLLELQVIVEATSSFFNGPGRKDSIRTAEFMIGLMNGVNTIYRKELNVNIIIPRLQIWTATTQDPYVSNGNAPALLDEVQNRWGKLTTIKRDIVHCLDAVPTTGGLFVLGIANGIGNICSGSISDAYSVSGIFKNGLAKIEDYMGDIVTIAHELGHNIGSYHTHNCQFWPPRGLDSCMTSGSAYRSRSNYSQEACFKNLPMVNPGSIMSYCHLTNPSRSVAFTFLPRVATYLRNYMESRSCIEPATQPIVRMVYPWGQQSFVVGTQTSIDWTSHRVTNVNIEFSTDGGTNWRTIFASRPAVTEANGTGSFLWTIPDNPTTKGRIRIVDATNNQIRDTSWADFTIAKATLTLTSDFRSKKYGMKERISLNWTKALVDRVRIEFSSNNGSIWSLIRDSLSNTTFTVDIPDVESKDCLFRIVDVENGKLISQSALFEIGKEQLALLQPANNDTLCLGKPYTITWSHTFMSNSKIFIEYRNVGQTTWKRVSLLGHDADSAKFAWTLNNVTAGTYQFRTVYRQDTSLSTIPINLFFSSEGSCATAASISDLDYSAFTLFPNPSSEFVKIIPTKEMCVNPKMIISDIAGSSMVEMMDLTLHSASGTDISVKHLTSGTYYITLICNDRRYTQSFTILR